ncbi:MAG: TlpA family protein disulfide reductase [Bacteroidaceae bacterium]|nr:TlpA family protein disulfide reductase [Bacteroidaceae bacterium]
MKKTTFLVAFITALNATAKDKVVHNPVFSEGSGRFLPRTVILGKTATTVGIKLYSVGWTLNKESHLVVDGKTYRLNGATVFTRKEGIVTDSADLDFAKHYERENDSISLEFEPLDPKATVFDFVEEEGSTFNVSGIRLDNKLYPFVLGKPKPFPYDKNEPLQPLEPTYGTAKFTCNQYRHDGTTKTALVFGCFNAFSTGLFKDDSENGYEFQTSRMYKVPVKMPSPMTQFWALMIPGQEVTINVDETALMATGVDRKIPEHSVIQFEGPLGDLQQVYYQERWMGHGPIAKVPADSVWDALQTKIREIESRKDYSRRQKEFGRIMAEWFYLRRYHKDAEAGIVQLQDPHAADLILLKDGRSFYFLEDDAFLEYAHANHIGGVATQWMEDYAKAMNLAKRMRGLELMPEEAFDTIPSYFRKELLTINDSTRVAIERLRATAHEVTVKDTPDCTGEEFLDYVVRENPDVVLFFDFWATWCGPCMRGIRAMELLKAEWAGRPIRFVYVTNETSPVLEWSKQINSMPGLHYRLPDDLWNKIPGFGGGIPQYFIYDRKGRQFYEQTGFSDIEPLKQKITEALSQ